MLRSHFGSNFQAQSSLLHINFVLMAGWDAQRREDQMTLRHIYDELAAEAKLSPEEKEAKAHFEALEAKKALKKAVEAQAKKALETKTTSRPEVG